MIVIGLGSGRSGTASLAKLLNSQVDGLCFHELNPSCSAFTGTPRPMMNTAAEFAAILDGGDPSMLTADLSRRVTAEAYAKLSKMTTVRLIGDIAFYYLTYVEQLAGTSDRIRFVCLKRDRQENIKSWLRKAAIKRWPSRMLADRLAALIMRTPFHHSYNYWMEHDGSRWRLDPVWDKCFPKFDTDNIETAIGMYWDSYYAEAERLQTILGDRFITVNTESLNQEDEQRHILDFCGIPAELQVITDAHIHRSETL